MVTQVLSQSLFELISQVVVYRSCIAHCKLNISFQFISLTPLGPELKHNLYLNYIETENLANETTFGLMEKWSYLWSGHYKLSGGETKNFRWTKSIQRSKNILLLQFQNMEDISVRRGRKLISGLYYLCKCKIIILQDTDIYTRQGYHWGSFLFCFWCNRFPLFVPV